MTADRSTRALTADELAYYSKRLVVALDPRSRTAHFTVDGNTFDVTTGDVWNDRHANVINKLHVFGLTAEDAREIAALTGSKVKVTR